MFLYHVVSKNQFVVLLLICFGLFAFILLISALSLTIYCHLLLLCMFASFGSRDFRCSVKLLVWDLCNFFVKTHNTTFLLTLPSLCPLSLGVLFIHFHWILESLSFLSLFLYYIVVFQHGELISFHEFVRFLLFILLKSSFNLW